MEQITTSRIARKPVDRPSRRPRPAAAPSARASLVLEWVGLVDALAEMRRKVLAAEGRGDLAAGETSVALSALDAAHIEMTDSRPRLTGC